MTETFDSDQHQAHLKHVLSTPSQDDRLVEYLVQCMLSEQVLYPPRSSDGRCSVLDHFAEGNLNHSSEEAKDLLEKSATILISRLADSPRWKERLLPVIQELVKRVVDFDRLQFNARVHQASDEE